MKTNWFNIVLLLLLVTTTFTACNKKQSVKPNIAPQWSSIQTWEFSGKMAINDGKDSGSGRISWKVNNETTLAQFKAPLGQGSWTITEGINSAELLSSKYGKTIANNATDLISNELGWQFPWNSISYWIRGYQTNQHLSSHDTLPKSFKDNGWEITFQKWMKTPIGMLPKKVKATKDNYSVKLIVYNWDITPK